MVKKCLLVAAILAFTACLPASASATTQTIWDDTLIKAYNPKTGSTSDWKDIEGKPERFQTTRIDVTLSGTNSENVTFEIFTNITANGVYDQQYLFKPADLALDLNQDGTFEKGISLFNGNLFGIAQYPHAFQVGGLYTVGSWNAPEVFYNPSPVYLPIRSSYGDVAKNPTGPILDTIVWIRSGTYTGITAGVQWIPYTEGSLTDKTLWKILITLPGINTNGDWNDFDLFWGTATCANDSIAGTVHIPSVPIPSTVWLMASGLVGLAGLRRRSKR